VEAVNERKGPSLDLYPVLSKFQDVFPNELLRLPPEREIDVTIELKPSVEPISKTPYHMTSPKICELQLHLKELMANKAHCFTLGHASNFCKEEGRILTTVYRLQGLELCYSEK
jgi:hypothetical protein